MQSELEQLANPIPALAISPGVAIGPVRLLKVADTDNEGGATRISPDKIEAEQLKLHLALENATGELGQLGRQIVKTVGPEEAAIFEAQQCMLQDPDLVAETRALITQQCFSATAALKQVTEQQAQQLEALENKALAARAADLRDVARRVIRHLLDHPLEAQKDALVDKTPVLLVAYDLTPSDTANLASQAVLGICTVVGGPTTHAAILARALEIPAIAGIDPQLLNWLQDAQQIAIDGSRGLLYLHPDAQQKQELHSHMRQHLQERIASRGPQQRQWRTRPGATSDGYPVQVCANVGDLASVQSAAKLGAEGIGLLRTEFLFNGRQVFPTEQEQFESYVTLFEAFAKEALSGKTIVARTLDAGADKPFPALERLIGKQEEANPALGLRGIRIHLHHEELLRQQLRALLRAASLSEIKLHIMFPMITTVEEVQRLQSIYLKTRQELQEEGVALPRGIKLGIMIETPAAALMTDTLASKVDFLSIGANDLYQYTLAADRTNSQVAAMFGRFEPAVWRLIAYIVRAAVSHKKHVAVCGELAADPKLGPLLAGLGVEELSMSSPAIGRVKAALHQQPLSYWQDWASKLLKAETAAEMQVLLNSVRP